MNNKLKVQIKQVFELCHSIDADELKSSIMDSKKALSKYETIGIIHDNPSQYMKKADASGSQIEALESLLTTVEKFKGIIFTSD